MHDLGHSLATNTSKDCRLRPHPRASPLPSVDYEGSDYSKYYDLNAPWGRAAYIKFTVTIQVGVGWVWGNARPFLCGRGDTPHAAFLPYHAPCRLRNPPESARD